MFSAEVAIFVQQILFRPVVHYSAGQAGTICRSLDDIQKEPPAPRVDFEIETRGIICSKKVDIFTSMKPLADYVN